MLNSDPLFGLFWLFILLPLLGALAIPLFPRRGKRIAFALALLLPFLLSGLAMRGLASMETGLPAFLGKIELVSELGASLSVGLSGLNVSFLLLTSLLLPAAFWAGRNEGKPFLFGLLIAGSGLLATFAAQDLLLFLIGWMTTILATFFLLAGAGKNPLASQKFLSMHGLGAFLLLFAFAAIQVSSGNRIDFNTLLSAKPLTNAPFWLQNAAYGSLLFAFLVPFAVFPFHTWFIEAFETAPPALQILLAGVFLKVGAYGLLLFNAGMFPTQQRAILPWLLFLGILTVIGAAFVAFKQDELSPLLASATVSQGGLVLLGILSGQLPGIEGALLLSLGHGLAIAALLSRASIPSAFAFVGLPGFLGFIGLALLLAGGWTVTPWFALTMILAQVPIIGGLVLYFGRGKAASWRESAPAASLLFVSLLLGIFPSLLLGPLNRALLPLMPLFGF